MARSDPNSPEPSGRMLDKGKMRHSSGSGLDEEDRTIHSGHFMLSRVHDWENEEEDESFSFSNDPRGFDFCEANKFPSRTYTFGPRSTQTLAIDASLTKLFDCMTLAYSGKITSPKWKPFKGMPLSLKDKVRLNNIIWREWPMQYIYCRKPVVCQFATPVSDEVHTKPEAVVLEGKYWKRRLDTVTAEYKKWRKYYKERVLIRPPEVNISELASHDDLLERVREVNQALPRPASNQTDLNLLTEDEFIMDFSDTLFTSLNPPFAFPNPRELSQSGYADIIQPGLMQLQPNLDDLCMDTFDPLQEMFNLRSQQNVGPPGFTASSIKQVTAPLDHQTSLAQGDFTSLSSMGFPMDLLNSLGISTSLQQQQQSQVLFNAALSTPASQLQLPNANMSIPQFNQIQSMDSSSSPSPLTPDTQMIVDPPETSSQYSPVPSQNALAQNNRKTQRADSQKGGNSRTRNLSGPSAVSSAHSKVKHPSVRFASPQGRPSGQAIKTSPSIHSKPSSPHAQASTTRLVSSPGKPVSETADKREGTFVVPKGKSVPRKQRPIAPAPSAHTANVATTTPSASPVVQKNTYLAQLLTTGNYPGAIKVKNEPAVPLGPCGAAGSPAGTLSQFRPITTSQPVQTNSPAPSTITMQPLAPAGSIAIVSDFPASVLIAAASQALGTTTVTAKNVVSIAHSPKSISSPSPTPISTPTPSPSALPHPILSSSPLPSSPSPIPSLGSPAPISSPPMTDFNLASSPSPTKAGGPGAQTKSDNHRAPHHELRKLSHISAEQKRRFNIKSGFDVIHALIPSLSQNPNAKVSKAAMLQKTAEYCKKLKSERTQMQNEAEILKQEIESLNSAINVCQLQLPATGVPVTRQRADKMKEMFEEYVKNRTLHNWKFWIFSIIIRSLFDSYNSMVSTVSLDEMCRTALAWLDQHCSLVSLRPTVLNSLRHLSTTTSILSDPSQVPEQVTRAVTRQNSSDNPNQT